MSSYHIISWNVNGIRATLKKGFLDWFHKVSPDILCIQETKADIEQIPNDVKSLEGYNTYFSSGEKKGYSGVGLFSKPAPLSVVHSLDNPKFDNEGRIILAEYPEFFLYGIYFPNGQSSPERLAYKLDFYDCFLNHAEEKRKLKPVIITGDVNTAHKEIDLARPKENQKNSGFLPEERAWVDKLIATGYIDTFRMFVPEGGHYTYWDQRFNSRDRNVGWRIDYFFVSEEIKNNVKRAYITPDILGSDHCPLGLQIEF